MKNLLLILLLANILYFLWGVATEPDEPPGVAVLDERELGPPLPAAQEMTVAMADDTPVEDDVEDAEVPEKEAETTGDADADDAPAEDEPETDDEPRQLAAIVGQSCVTIGPFRASTDADEAKTQYAAEGMRTRMRAAEGQIFVGHWVQIRNISDRAAGNEMLDKLHEGGLSDAYIVETDDEGMKISLGLFGDIDGAERIELQADSLGFDAEIAPRMSDSMLHFVDIALPPGKGAGAIVEKYGEEKVKLRDDATCPPSGSG